MTENAFSIFLSGFVEPIHVKLTYEAVNFLVAEVLGEYYLLELSDVLDDELLAASSPIYDLPEFLILSKINTTLKI